MHRAETPKYAQEEEARIQLANDLDAMTQTRGWAHIEHRFTEIVDEARTKALNVATESQANATDVLRQWQIKDEVISSFRHEISQLLEERSEFVQRPEDLLVSLIQEQLDGRRTGDPGSVRRTD